MSDLNLEYFQHVSHELEQYPPKDKLLGATRKIVLVLNDEDELIYNFLASQYGEIKSSRNLIVPKVLEADNATFLFGLAWTGVIANQIYAREIISDSSIEAKVLYMQHSVTVPEFCKHCLASFFCAPNLELPCFAHDRHDIETKLSKDFFKFLLEQLQFEPIDAASFVFEWDLYLDDNSRLEVNSELKDKIEIFAVKVCDYLAPVMTYKNNTIKSQNDTYTRLQMINQFRYDPVDHSIHLPTNFEDVFQRSNVSIDTIKGDWVAIKVVHELLRNWKYFENNQTVDDQISECRNNLDFNALKYYDEKEKVRMIDNQLYEFETNKFAFTFKHVIGGKLKDIANELLNTIVTKHAVEFSKALHQLNIWSDANMMRPEHQHKIPKFFEILEKEFEKYFGNQSKWIIYNWFCAHQNRVPIDWLPRLRGYERDYSFLIAGYHYSTDLEGYLGNISDVSEYIHLVDYVAREKFGKLFYFQLYPNHKLYLQLKELSESREGASNLSQLFEDFKFRDGSYVKEIIEAFALLEEKFKNTFLNTTIPKKLPNISTYLKRILFHYNEKVRCRDIEQSSRQLYLQAHLLTYPNIFDKLREQAQSLFLAFKTDFFNRNAQELISIEKAYIESVGTRFNVMLSQHLKSKFNDWHLSQPYKKLSALKYTHDQFDDFFKEIEIIFASVQLPIPEEDKRYLKNLQSQFKQIQKLATDLSIEAKISTKGDWGGGIRLSQDYNSNAAVSLGSPINYAFGTLATAVELPIMCAFNTNSLLLLASVVFLKVRKLGWIKKWFKN